MTQGELLKVKGRMATSGICNAAAAMEPFQSNLNGKDVGLIVIHEALQEEVEKIQSGDLSMVESMLYSQASVLQTMSTSLVRRGAAQENLKWYQTFMGLALKAQAQSRATLEALIELKQPRQQPVFAKQANIAAGHQQVNNTYASASGDTDMSSHVENSQIEKNELLEVGNGERVDFGAQGQAGRGDSTVEPLGTVNRAKKH